MIRRLWNIVMNSKNNPLNVLPKTVRFEIMVVLSLMWSAIFALNTGLLLWYPGLVMVHVVLLLFGIFGTGFVFKIFSKDENNDK